MRLRRTSRSSCGFKAVGRELPAYALRSRKTAPVRAATTATSLVAAFCLLTPTLIPAHATIVKRSHSRVARATHALKASDKAKLHYISASGATLYETGRASGMLPGSMRVRMVLGATFHGSFTIFTHGGSIKGHGSAQPHGSGVIESFKGSLFVTGGSGRFKHAHGRAALYGTFNRNSYALTIQTAGTLHY